MLKNPPISMLDSCGANAMPVRTLDETRRLREWKAGEPNSLPWQGETETQLRILNALPAHIALLDPQAVIVFVNDAWRGFATDNLLHAPDGCVGQNYLQVCDRADGTDSDEANPVASGIRQVLCGEVKEFALEYPCHSPQEKRWFRLMVTPQRGDGRSGAVVMHIDITERKVAERAAGLLAAIVNSSLDAIVSKDLHGIVTSWNSGAEKIFGYTSEEIIGRSITLLIPPDRMDEEVQILDQIRRGDCIEHFETVRVHKDGRLVDVSVTESPIRDVTGEIFGASKVARDISGAKQAEAALRETRARLNSTLAAGLIGTWTWDIVNDSLVADEFTARMFSVEADAAAIGLPAADYLRAVMEEDQPGVADGLARAIHSCGDYDIEYRVRPEGGEVRWLQAKGRVEGDAAGNAVNFHGAVMDITIRKLGQAAIHQSEEHFRFLDQLAEATRALAGPDEIMSVMARMLGVHLRASRCAYADVEEDGEWFTILHDYTDGCVSTVGIYQLSLFGPRAVATLDAGQTLIIHNVREELSPGDGADMFNAIGIQATIVCPLVKEGVLRAMMAMHQTTPRNWQASEISLVRDVVDRCWATIERRAAEEKIHRLNSELEQRVIERTSQLETANKELEAFSYSVSHDLRAPLRAVDGFSQAVLEDYGSLLPEDGQRCLQTIRNGAQRMGQLIDDLLTFSRLSRLPLAMTTVDTRRLVSETLEELKSEQSGRKIDIRLGELPPCQGDPALLKQVWLNLLSNALKYTNQREQAVIEIDSMQAKGATVFFVRDNGTGFDMRYADKLFGVFQRLHRQEEFEGTGVGLALVQRIVHRHAGRVWAEAAVEQGATFYFTLEEETES